MWRRKKLIIVAVLAATILLVVGMGTVAFAETESTDDAISGKTLSARVAAILGIDQQTVEDAFAQAKSDMQAEALDSRLQKLVDGGEITQEQADQYQAWYQAKPDMAPFQQQLKEWQQSRPGMPPELNEWQEAKPEMPFRFGFKGQGGFRGKRGVRGFGGMPTPAE
ncbi:hypothetical protein ACFLUR_03450 [Chloroflexota bacterium]